jgi:signal transduction histidine kinase
MKNNAVEKPLAGKSVPSVVATACCGNLVAEKTWHRRKFRNYQKETMDSILKTLFLSIMLFLFGGSAALAAEHATANEAVAFTKSAIEYIKAEGQENALKEFNDPKGKFHKGELYITVFDLNGMQLANGSNHRAVGKNLINLKDADDVYFIQERIKMVKAKGSGWLDYNWPNPVTKNIEHKSMYSEKLGDIIVSCGIYK